MERYTKKNRLNAYITPFCTRYDDDEFHECYVGASVDRLGEYENTKLQPKQVEKLKGKYKELQKENRKLKKEMLKMLNYAWYNQEDDDEQE